MPLDLTKPCTQAEFGELVGISRQRVGFLVKEGALTDGATAHEWLLAYCQQLRDGAAGRGEEVDSLTKERALQVRVARERDEIRLAVDRAEFAPVAVLEQALSTLGGRIVSVLRPVHLEVQKLVPDLPPEAVAAIEKRVQQACAAAETASLETLVPKDETAEDDEDDAG